jgi:hypothetical protein
MAGMARRSQPMGSARDRQPPRSRAPTLTFCHTRHEGWGRTPDGGTDW